MQQYDKKDKINIPFLVFWPVYLIIVIYGYSELLKKVLTGD